MKVMSFNIRVDVDGDGIHAFPHRIDGIIKFINQENPDIIGFQEVRPQMLEILSSRLDDYDFVGESRAENDEFNPIFYKKNHHLIQTKTFWYGKTPTVFGSKHPDAHYPRIYTLIHIEIDKKNYEIVNTHLSHISHLARVQSMTSLVDYYINRKNNYPFILLGDFNAYPHDDVNHIISPFLESCWRNHMGDKLTFHGFSSRKQGLPIDYIFYSKNLNVKNFIVHRKKYNNNYLSDHSPISLELE